MARLFEEIAQSLEVAGEQGHRLRAYRRAAHGVAAESEPLEQLAATGRLRQIAGVGASLEALIAEFLSTGGMRTHAKLVGDNPPGLAPLLQARGFGPAGVQALHAALGATDLDAVERAADEGRLAEVLGQRRAEDLIAQLPVAAQPDPYVALEVGLGVGQVDPGTAGRPERGTTAHRGGRRRAAHVRERPRRPGPGRNPGAGQRRRDGVARPGGTPAQR